MINIKVSRENVQNKSSYYDKRLYYDKYQGKQEISFEQGQRIFKNIGTCGLGCPRIGISPKIS